MPLEETQNFEKLLCLRDEAVTALEKTGPKGMAAVILSGLGNVIFNILNRTPGKPHSLVIDTKVAIVPGTAAGGAHQKTIGYVDGTNRSPL